MSIKLKKGLLKARINGSMKDVAAIVAGGGGGGGSYDDTELRHLIAQKYTKPGGGIPASDIADGVIPTDSHINQLIDNKVSVLESLANEIDEVIG